MIENNHNMNVCPRCAGGQMVYDPMDNEDVCLQCSYRRKAVNPPKRPRGRPVVIPPAEAQILKRILERVPISMMAKATGHDYKTLQRIREGR